MELTRTVLYSADASTPVRQADENITKWTRTERLRQKNQLTARLMRGSDEWAKFTRRRLVKLDFGGDKANEWWRIKSISDRSSQDIQLTFEPRYVGLEDTIAYVQAAGRRLPRVVITGLSPSDALDRILNDLPAPTLYAPGSVASTFQGEKVYVWGEGVSYWRLLHDVVSEEKGGVDGQLRFEWDGSQYLVHVDEPGGGTQTTITFSSLTDGIRGKDLSYTIDDQNYVSAVAPIGGPRNSRITIAEARWAVASSTYDNAADETTLTTQGTPVWDDGALVGRLVEHEDGTTYEVVSTTRPDQVAVKGDASSADSFRFRTQNGEDLLTLTDDEAEREVGRAVQTKRFSQVSPAENLLVRAGVTDNCENTNGWSTQGTASLSTLFDIVSTQHGSASLKVTADKAASDPQNGIVTDPVSWSESEFGKYVSAVVQLRVISGSVGVELEDSSNRFPARGSDAEIVGAEDAIRGYQLGGFEPADGDLRLRIFALEDGTEFHVDAAAVTPTTNAQQYSSLMGPRALWDRAARHLRREGGIQPPRMDVTTFTTSDIPGYRGTLSAGDFVRVVTEAGLRLEPITTQVRQVKEELSIGKEAPEQKVTIGTRKKSFVDRAREPEPEPQPETAQTATA